MSASLRSGGGTRGAVAVGCGGACGTDRVGATGAAGTEGGGAAAALRASMGDADAGGTPGMPCGVGRRPGENGGTRVGVTPRGKPAGGVERPAPPNGPVPNAPPESRATATPSATVAEAPDVLTAGRGDAVRLAASCAVAKSSVQLRAAVMGMIPPHTEQRARTPGPGTRAGSTRKTDWHSGHETFMTRRPG